MVAQGQIYGDFSRSIRILIGLLFTLWSVGAMAESGPEEVADTKAKTKTKSEVIFLEQMHLPPPAQLRAMDKKDPKVKAMLQKVGRSQFQIAKEIMKSKTKKIAVFDEKVPNEGLTKDMMVCHGRDLDKKIRIPLPEKFEDLSKDEKYWFTSLPASVILLCTGQIEKVESAGYTDQRIIDVYPQFLEAVGEYNKRYPGNMDKALVNAFIAEYYPEVYRRVYTEREFFVAGKVWDLMEKGESAPDQIFIIFGMLHDFKPYFSGNSKRPYREKRLTGEANQ